SSLREGAEDQLRNSRQVRPLSAIAKIHGAASSFGNARSARTAKWSEGKVLPGFTSRTRWLWTRQCGLTRMPARQNPLCFKGFFIREAVDRTDGWVGDQIRAEVTVERHKRFRFGGRDPEADVAVGADQDHAARRQAGAGGIHIWVVTDPHEFGPASSQPLERRRGWDGPENKHVVRRSTKPRPVWVALPGMRIRAVCPASSVVGDERASRVVDVDHGSGIAQQRG